MSAKKPRPKRFWRNLIVPHWESTKLPMDTTINNHKIGLIIPSTVNANEAASTEIVSKWVKCAKVQFAQLFGGFTSHNAVGGCLSPELGLIEENVTVVARFTNDHGLNRLGEVRAFAAKMGRALGQEAVAVEVDHRLEFIPPLGVAVTA